MAIDRDRVAEPVVSAETTQPDHAHAIVEFRVLAPDGDVVPDCEFQVVRSGIRVLESRRTDRDGVALFRLRETGMSIRVRVEEAPSGLAPPLAQLMAELSERPSGVFFAATYGKRTTCDVVLSRPAALLGMVVGADGMPLGGASVMLRSDGAAPGVFATTATGDDGMFRFELVGAARYDVLFAAAGLPTRMRSIDLSGGGRLVLDATVLGDGDRSVAGIVTDVEGRPFAGIEVWASDPDIARRHQFGGTRTDSAGRFRLEGLPAGRVAVQAHPMGMLEAMDSPDRLAAQIEPQIVDLATRSHVDGLHFRGERAEFYVARIQVRGRARRMRVFASPRSEQDHGESLDLDAEGRAKWVVDCPSTPVILSVAYRAEGQPDDEEIERTLVPRANVAEDVVVVVPR